MSLILDALKKADAERALGRAPGLQGQPMPLPIGDHADDGTGSAGRRPVTALAAAAALLLVAAGGAAWWGWTRTPAAPAPGQSPTVAAPGAPSQSLPAPPVVTAPVPQAPAVAAAPLVAPSASASGTSPGSRTPTQTASPAAAAPPQAALPTARTERPPRAATAVPAASAALPQAGRPPAASAAAVLPLESLPDELRRTVPPIAIGGSIYADRAADRILIVNGQALKEGDTLDGRLVLEGIGRQSATWRLGEQRFSTRF